MQKRKWILLEALFFLSLVTALVGSAYRHRFRYPYPVTAAADLSQHVALMEERIRRYPDSALDRAVLASFYAAEAKRRGDATLYDRAQRLANESLTLLPFANASAKLTLAKVEEARHHFREAIRLADEVARDGRRRESLGTLITSHLALGELDEASRLAGELAQAKPSLMSYALEGLVLASQGKDDAAQTKFESALRVEDIGEVQDSAWVRSIAARHALKRGRISMARLLLEEALRIVPDYHFALDLTGQLELQDGHYAAAVRAFDGAFASSKQVLYLRHSAWAMTLAGNRPAAEVLLGEAERILRDELSSGQYGHRLELTQLVLDRGASREPGEAMGLAKAEWTLRPTAETGYVLARALGNEGQWDEAGRVMQAVLASGVKDARYFELCAVIERALGHADAAGRYRGLAAEENAAVQGLMERDGDGAAVTLWL